MVSRPAERCRTGLVVLALVLVAACGERNPRAGDTAVAEPLIPTTTSALAQAEPEPALGPVLEGLALQPGDVPDTSRSLLRNGDQVANQVTLDFCGARFPSEARRVARRQYSFQRGETLVVGNELVAYTDADAARKALLEVVASVKTCLPSQVRQSNVAGVPPARYRMSIMRESEVARVGTLAAGEVRLGLVQRMQPVNGEAPSAVSVIYLVRGRFLVTSFAPDTATTITYATVLAGRLAGLSSEPTSV